MRKRLLSHRVNKLLYLPIVQRNATVDLEEYVGWVDGMYIFNDRPLGDIMKTFERWYDIQVYYETP